MKELSNKKKQPFIVPDGYFENLPYKILNQINEIPPKSSKTEYFVILRRQLLAAAAFIGFVLTCYFSYKLILNSFNDNGKQLAKQSSYEEALLAKVDEYDLINILTNEEHQITIESEALENYLIEEDINEQTISENLYP